ncbi:hypothetical protein BDA99DRAFT_517447 [Phascolomyces articulosus]|uniref:Ankyrin n=1 Tax=Phascolomyces articulosus TaxID=60185 RepID=A0AAD5JV39_9FUNG|nr:hypothetical protein BDA99DRAFT_517447 [Phascolomyces articulosus]
MSGKMHDQKKDKSKDYLLGLHWAATTGNVGLVKFALDHGAPIDAVVNGFMPLQLACISDNNIAVVQYLIDRGAEVNAQRWSKKHSADKSQAVAGAIGSTALHVACANGCVKIVDLLLRNGALVHVKDKYGSSPLDIAAAKHHVEIVRLLETFGAMQQRRTTRHSTYEFGNQHHHHHHPNSSSCSSHYSRHSNNSTTTHSSSDDSSIVMGRKSMDVTSMTQSEKAERFRRPSLPSVFEGKAPLHVPPLSTLPPKKATPPTTSSSSSSSTTQQQAPAMSSDPRAPRRSLNIPRPTQEELTAIITPPSPQSIDIRRRHSSTRNKTPELSSSKSSDESTATTTTTPPEDYSTLENGGTSSHNPWAIAESQSLSPQPSGQQPDWYGYGVVNRYDDENYLLSLERRAFNTNNDEIIGRRSLDRSPSSNNNGPRQSSLKRCSSDGGHLRTTALMNAMAANTTPAGADTNPGDAGMVDMDGEPTPRPSVILDDDPEAEALRDFQEREMKKAWWSAFGGRKSMDVATYHYGRGSLDVPRKSLDLRPSLDSLQQLAKKSVEGLSRRSVDYQERPSSPADQYSPSSRPGFLSRLVGAWSKK